MKKLRNIKSGFTYIEVMIATVIIALISAFFATSISSALSNGAQVMDITKGTELAQRYMETVKSELSYQSNYDAIQTGTTAPVAVTSDFTDNGYFTVQTTVTDLETATIDGSTKTVLRQIDVEYIRASDDLSIIDISTLAARPGY